MKRSEVGYLELLRRNPGFRRLWIANVVSLLGDWFNTIALYTLVNDLTGSPFALGGVFLCKMLPAALASPLAGILADRLNRRRLMIASDLLRAVVVLGFLVVDEPREVLLLYALTSLQVMLGAIFEPARSAALPNVAQRHELLTANTLLSSTWSVMLAAGAALGGIATELLGVRAVFLVDSVTYLVSAAFIMGTTIPQHSTGHDRGTVVTRAAADLVEGWRYLRRHPDIGRIAAVKATASLGGGGLVYMLALLGGAIWPQAEAFGIGVLLAVRGLGTALGPVVARSWFPDQRLWPRIITIAIVFWGLVYTMMSWIPFSPLVILLVFVAHVAGGTQWVLSAVLLQQRTDDAVRGRVFATEWLLLMLAQSTSILVASGTLESSVLDLRGALGAFGLLQIAAGLAWGATALRAPTRSGKSSPALAIADAASAPETSETPGEETSDTL